MRSALVATTCALALTASLGLSACGGGNDPTDKIPTSAPALVPPSDANDLASGGTGTNTTTSTTGTTTTDTTTTDNGGSTDTGASTGTGTDTGAGTGTGNGTGTGGTGGTDTGTGTGGNTNTTAPNPGGVTPDATAGAGSFQGFCDSNPGAC
jgi:hypothetical protein